MVWIARQLATAPDHSAAQHDGLTSSVARGCHEAKMWTTEPSKLSRNGSQGRSQSYSLQDQRLDRVDLAAQGGVLFDALGDLLDGRDDRRVVLAAERAREVWIRVLGVVARQVH